MLNVPAKAIFSVLVLALSASTSLYGQAEAQPNAQTAGHSATYITAGDLQTVWDRSGGKKGVDQQVSVVEVNNEYHVAVGIVHRSKAAAATSGGVEHSDVTEVYYIVSGSGTLVTGGKIKDEKSPERGGPSGPTSSGGPILSGVSKNVGPGDVVIIPQDTPHWFSSVASDEIVYVVMRADPHKVLPVMNALEK